MMATTTFLKFPVEEEVGDLLASIVGVTWQGFSAAFWGAHPCMCCLLVHTPESA